MVELFSFATVLDNSGKEGRQKLDPLSFTETLVWILYRLFEFAPLGQPTLTSMGYFDDATYLAMVAFMTTLLPKYSDGSSRLLCDRLSGATEDLRSTFASIQVFELPLVLWTLFVGGFIVPMSCDHQWLILETCKRLKLFDWPAVRSQLHRFPWICTIHDVLGQCLWEHTRQESIGILLERVDGSPESSEPFSE